MSSGVISLALLVTSTLGRAVMPRGIHGPEGGFVGGGRAKGVLKGFCLVGSVWDGLSCEDEAAE